MDSDYYKDIDVDEFVPQEADFAVHISGDSMMPQFSNQQIVYVHAQQDLEDSNAFPDVPIFVQLF